MTETKSVDAKASEDNAAQFDRSILRPTKIVKPPLTLPILLIGLANGYRNTRKNLKMPVILWKN
jgi:hypothetical protein